VFQCAFHTHMSVGQFLSVKERNIVRITIDKRKKQGGQESKWIDIIIYQHETHYVSFPSSRAYV